MRKGILLLVISLAFSCKDGSEVDKKQVRIWEPYNDSVEVAANADHEKGRMQYKLPSVLNV